MLDIRWIREHTAELEEMARLKGMEMNASELVAEDEERRELLKCVEAVRSQRNLLAQQVAERKRTGGAEDEIEQLQAEAKTLAAQIADVEALLREKESVCDRLLLHVPNRYAPDTPVGASDRDNVEVRSAGEPPEFGFMPRDHVELGEALQLVDIVRGVKLGREQTYRLGEDDLWLVGTAEVPLVSYYAGEVVDVGEPLRLAGVSNCFRREAGSAGRDVRGLYRVHQFAKVEQVVLCRADLAEGEEWLERITGYAEELLTLLELPYRVVRVCTGDLGFKNYKQYDIETWMPSRRAYGETHSSSLLLDFQSRRSNIRYRDENGRLQYVYTLNNTAVASPRILIPLLENHQQEDGTVSLPRALRPYMRGLSVLTK